MKTTFATILLALLASNLLFAQNEFNIWHFGTNAGIDFNSAVPVPLLGSPINTQEGCTSISDKTTGQLLFYMDGNTIYNRNHLPMLNGTGMLGHNSSSQTAMILPWPGNSQNYFVFTLDFESNPNSLRYSVVDMNLDVGLGGVTAVKNQTLLTNSLTEKMAATCVNNGRGHWIVTHGFNNNSFYAFRVSPTGLDLVPVVSSVGPIITGSSLPTIGTMKFAQDGSRAVMANYSITQHYLFDFDNTNGVFSNPITLNSSSETYGSAFSPDGSKVYLSGCCLGANDVVQYDLTVPTSAAINASRTVVFNGSAPGKGTMQIGPDNRIYIAKLNQTSLDVIANPNQTGAACGYITNGFFLGGPTCRLGLPNFPACVQSVILDAELGTFHAELTANSEVFLYWEAMEKASEGTYEVERSADGAYFSTIGEVPFAGSQSEMVSREFLDRNPLPDNNFYRIKVTDPNGEISLSQVVEIAPQSALGTQVHLSPHPARAHVELSMYVQGERAAPWQVQVYSLTGKLVLQSQLGNLPAGKNVHQLDLEGMKAGIYLLKLSCGTEQEVLRLVVAD